MGTKPPQGVGEMIRDVLRKYQPISMTEVLQEINISRKGVGKKRIKTPTMKRYFKEAVSLGILEIVDTEPRHDAGKGGVLEDASVRNRYHIVRGYTEDQRWGYLPSIVAGTRE